MEKKNSVFTSFKNMFKNLFVGKKDIDNDALLSPSQQIKRNFFENKLGVTGLISFITIFVVVFGTTTFGKPYNAFVHDTPLQNIGPGRNFLKVDKNLKNPVKIDSGVSFSLGLDEEGKVYFWGKNPAYNAVVKDILKETKDVKVVDIAAGARHAIAITQTGDIVGAGLNNFDQAEFTSELKQRMIGEKAIKVGAHSSYSAVLTESGKMFVWGSTNANDLQFVPQDIQGRIKDFAVTPFNIITILDDGTLSVFGIRGSEINTQVPQELKDGSVNVVQVAASENSAIALDDQGNLYGWGKMSGVNMKELPEFEGEIVKVSATQKSYNVLTDDNKVYAFGNGKYGLNDAPTDKKVKDIFSSYYSSYAVEDNGNVHAWGLKGFLLGSDGFGRDVGQRLLYGGRISLTVGAVAIVISLVIGVTVGLIAGFYGGILDNILMRVAEVVSAFPFMPLAFTLSALIPSEVSQNTRLLMIMVILGVISWPGVARLVRGQILAEREKDFVLAARALGLKETTIILKHILPSVFNLIIVNMTLGYASSLLTEAGLSFLGFGVKAPYPSWGNMLNGVVNSIAIERYWWQWLLPAGMVLLAALSVNLVGDALRDAMDPRSNRS